MANRKRAFSQDLEDTPASKINRTDDELRVIFGNMRLKRIVKENHGHAISQLSFLFNHKHVAKSANVIDTSNILGSVGGCELSIYDNEHCGDHLDIMSNFDITPCNVKDEPKHQLNTMCWFYKDGDALIATAGADTMIHVLSLANSEQVTLLKGHTNTITDLQSHPLNHNHMLSTSKDGTIRLWDIDQEKCLFIFETGATLTVSCFHPLGTTFVTGSETGDLFEWTVPTIESDSTNNIPRIVYKKDTRVLKKMHSINHIDCIRYANGNLITKSVDNQLHYWNPKHDAQSLLIHSFSVHSKENNSRFDVSLDECYLCVGSDQGAIYVYNIHTSDMVAELSHKKSTRAIQCCVFNRHCRQIVAAGEDAFMMRYDYIDDKTLEEWDNWKKAD